MNSPASSIRSSLDFRGDFAAVADFMERSWAGNKDQSLRYTPEFLENSFTYPGTKIEIAAAIYKEEQPVAFVAGFPRTVRLGGELVDLAVNTFLTVDPRFQGKAYGAVVWSEFVKRAEAAGYDGTINFCVDGAPTNGIVQICGERLGYPVNKVFSATHLAKLLKPGVNRSIGQNLSGNVELFLELAGAVTEPPLARIWSDAEAAWQCRTRYGAVCVRQEAGPRRGLLTGYVMQIIGGSKCLLVEDLLWGSLESPERIQLLEKLLEAGADAGAEMAVVPRMRYADEDPLLKSGFRKSRRVVHTYLTTWREGLFNRPLESQYIDIF